MATSFDLSKSRYSQLEWELRYALDNTSKEEFKEWAKCTAMVFPKVTVRRAKNLGEFAGSVVKGTASEAKQFINASLEWRLLSHTKKRTSDLADFSQESYKDFRDLTKTIIKMTREDPKKTAIQMFMAVMGFNIGGGGLDGDGGIPDLDLLVSIGQHRSILTHSVIPMIVIEGVCISLVGLVQIIHGNLPSKHDPLWDQIKSNNESVLESFYAGMSLGLAYHLGVDGTIQGEGTYKNLPFSMPQIGHQLIAGANSMTEFIDTTKTKIIKKLK